MRRTKFPSTLHWRRFRSKSSSFVGRVISAIRTASAEDIIVLKSFSGRDKDWLDVRGIVTRQNQRLDWDYTVENLQMLCEMNEDLSPLDRLAEFRQQ